MTAPSPLAPPPPPLSSIFLAGVLVAPGPGSRLTRPRRPGRGGPGAAARRSRCGRQALRPPGGAAAAETGAGRPSGHWACRRVSPVRSGWQDRLIVACQPGRCRWLGHRQPSNAGVVLRRLTAVVFLHNACPATTGFEHDKTWILHRMPHALRGSGR